MTEDKSLFLPVTLPARRVLGEHPNVTVLLDGVEQDPKQLDTLFKSFDNAVKDYNSIDAGNLPQDLNFLPEIKPVLPTMPTIEEMLKSSKLGTYRAFVRGLHTMEPLMTRGESDQPEPSIRFHVWEGASDKQRLVGGIFQAYGITVANIVSERFKEKDKLYKLRNTLLDGLIEIMALNKDKHQNDPVFEVVKSIGWFQAKDAGGKYLFTKTVRDMAK